MPGSLGDFSPAGTPAKILVGPAVDCGLVRIPDLHPTDVMVGVDDPLGSGLGEETADCLLELTVDGLRLETSLEEKIRERNTEFCELESSG